MFMSELANTGMQRATELTVDKKIGSISGNGYPRVYRIGDAFGNYTAKSNTELAQMTATDYRTRLIAFKVYVESIEVGVTVDTESAYTQNLNSCPIVIQ